MPFKSKAQQRFMFAAEKRGDLPEGTAEEWAHHTPNIKALPEHVKKKKKKKKTEDQHAKAAEDQTHPDIPPKGDTFNSPWTQGMQIEGNFQKASAEGPPKTMKQIAGSTDRALQRYNERIMAKIHGVERIKPSGFLRGFGNVAKAAVKT